MSLKVSLIFCIIGVLWTSVSARNITTHGDWHGKLEECNNSERQVYKTEKHIENRPINGVPFDTFTNETVITAGGTFKLFLGTRPIDINLSEVQLYHWAAYDDWQNYYRNLHELVEEPMAYELAHLLIDLYIRRNGECKLKIEAAVHAASENCVKVEWQMENITIVN